MLTLGNRNELLLDDYLLDTAENITLDIQRPVRQGRVFSFDKPWEGISCLYHSLIQNPEDGKIWLYYRGSDANSTVRFKTGDKTCLAVSEDGIHFERVDLDGRNVVTDNEWHSHNFAPFYDTNPACKPDEHFKAMGLDKIPGENEAQQLVLRTYVSADGIHWKPNCQEPGVKEGMFDSLNAAFWDPSIGKYRCYSRCWTVAGGFNGLRAIQSCESEDFVHWTKPTPNTYNGGDAPVYEFYTNSTRPVPGAPHQLVAFPMRFVPTRHKIPEHPSKGVSDCVLISSRDGKDWTMRNCRPWIYPGLDDRQWTQRNFVVGSGIVELNDEWNFYTVEHYCWDDNGMYRYTTPRGRLGYAYSLDGSFVTKPFRLEGDRLTFNYNTSAVGTLGVTVLDEAGEPIEGCSFEVYGNELAYPVELAALKGRTLRLKIRLQDAYLYAIGY